MNWRIFISTAIGLLIVSPPIGDQVFARGPEFKPVLNKWFVGRCHMDYCDRHLITSANELGRHPGGYGVLFFVRSSDRLEQYDPDIGYEGQPIKIEKSRSSTMVFCSKTKPGVIFKIDGEQWVFRPLKPGEPEAEFGFNAGSYSWYYASCHNTTQPVGTKLAKRLGYKFSNGKLDDDIKIERPTEVLSWRAEFFSGAVSQRMEPETIGLERTYGDENGCYFYKEGNVKTDTGTYIDKKHVWHYEGGCNFLNVRNVTSMFSVSNIREAWSVKMVCQIEDETYSYDAIVRHNVEQDGSENVEIVSELDNGPQAQRLYPCS